MYQKEQTQKIKIKKKNQSHPIKITQIIKKKITRTKKNRKYL